MLRDEPYLFTAGVYSALDAQIAERVGLRSVYMSGYSVALLNGWPDMGFLTMTEMTKAASMMASAVKIPIIADADDGYGNALSTMRTVEEYIKTGVAGLDTSSSSSPSSGPTRPCTACGTPWRTSSPTRRRRSGPWSA